MLIKSLLKAVVQCLRKSLDWFNLESIVQYEFYALNRQYKTSMYWVQLMLNYINESAPGYQF